ncbi:hypothetical protein [Virgibacillus ihumii]|uniref:hypothetical protein n=1 Tax=Virgibacillus ihumii TaxID=2686091 RepID=UPI00157D9D34|nr:hypothetical protein [Virgibacillus ihumii]
MDWSVWQEMVPGWFDVVYVIIFAAVFICYLFVKVIVKWVISRQSIKLLSFLISSLVFLVLLLTGVIMTVTLDVDLLQITLRCLAAFGCCLLVLHVLQYFFLKLRS